MGGSEQLARLAGALAGLGLAFAAAFPFEGVPPRGVSGRPVPAQVEVRALASGELTIDPLGTVLPATAFPAPGVHAGPTVAVTARNISPLPLRLSIRLSGLAPALDDAATVRGSAAGAVMINGPLRTAGSWTQPAGVLPSGATTTLRLRFKLKAGLAPDAYNGRLDIRQLEMKGTPITAGPDASTPPGISPATATGAPSPATRATTPPATTPPATTPHQTSPATSTTPPTGPRS